MCVGRYAGHSARTESRPGLLGICGGGMWVLVPMGQARPSTSVGLDRCLELGNSRNVYGSELVDTLG